MIGCSSNFSNYSNAESFTRRSSSSLLSAFVHASTSVVPTLVVGIETLYALANEAAVLHVRFGTVPLCTTYVLPEVTVPYVDPDVIASVSRLMISGLNGEAAFAASSLRVQALFEW